MVTRIVARSPGNIYLHFVSSAAGRPAENDDVPATVSESMKPRRVVSVVLLCLLGAAGTVAADGRWRDLPPEERRQMRQQMREHWQQDREARREAAGPHWRDLPPEDRRRLRDEMRERRGWPDHRDGPDGAGRGWRRD